MSVERELLSAPWRWAVGPGGPPAPPGRYLTDPLVQTVYIAYKQPALRLLAKAQGALALGAGTLYFDLMLQSSYDVVAATGYKPVLSQFVLTYDFNSADLLFVPGAAAFAFPAAYPYTQSISRVGRFDPIYY